MHSSAAHVQFGKDERIAAKLFTRGIWKPRPRQLLRCVRLAVSSLLSCIPLLLVRRPKTPLRLLCIGAFDYVARLRGHSLGPNARTALACACDLGALRNDFYDQGTFDRRFYRELRHDLRRLVPESATHRYIRDLRQTERGRPAFGPGAFSEPAAVVEYRLRVLVVSLAWLQVISRRSMEPRVFQSFVALVGLIQLVDDLLDWKDDWACRRPTYVTAFLSDSARPSSRSVTPIRLHANRFCGLLIGTMEQDLNVAPLTVAGIFVWVVARALMKVRFSR